MCGERLVEGEAHHCKATEVLQAEERLEIRPQFIGDDKAEELAKIERETLFGLIHNPFSALKLRGELDLMYGLFGIFLSLGGYMLCMWSLKRNLIFSLLSPFQTTRYGLEEYYSEINERMSILSPLFVLGLVMMLALLLTSMILGNVFGKRKVTWKESITRVGAMQLIAGVGFLVVSLAMFVSVKVGILLLFVVILAILSLTMYGTLLISHIQPARIMPFIILFILAQLIVLIVISNTYTQEMFSDNINKLLLDF